MTAEQRSDEARRGTNRMIMCAGASPAGREFTARHADVGFTALEARDLDSMRARVDAHRKYAWDEHRRDVKVWTNAYIFQGETDKEARDYYNYCIFQKRDWGAVDNLVSMMGITSQSFAPHALEKLKEHFMAGWNGFPLIGTRDQVVDGLLTLAKTGFDGTLLSWPRYIEGMEEFRSVTYPLVKQAGLRG